MSTKPDKGLVTTAKLASMLELTPRRVQQLFTEGALPEETPDGKPLRCGKGKFYALRVLLELIRHYRTAQRGTGKTISEKREAYIEAKTKREELRYLKDIGQLLDYDAVMKLYTLIIGTYRDNLRSRGTRIAAPLSEEIVHRVKDTFTAALSKTDFAKKDIELLLRTIDSAINESRLRETLGELIKDKINTESADYLTELSDIKLIRGTFPEPLKPKTKSAAVEVKKKVKRNRKRERD